MASHRAPTGGLLEACSECGVEQVHEVSIELRTERATPENAAFSREPYRVAECTVCGTTAATRLNDA